jgi:hypothetical protein
MKVKEIWFSTQDHFVSFGIGDDDSCINFAMTKDWYMKPNGEPNNPVGITSLYPKMGRYKRKYDSE